MKKGYQFKRAGKSKPWAFMERFDIPDVSNPTRTYLTRWRIIQTPFFAIYLHRMLTPDGRPILHDHPWSFISFIIRGGYVEQRLNLHTRTKERKHRRFVNVMRRDDAHYIESLDRIPTWTFLLVGRRRRTWGYWEPAVAFQQGQAPRQWTWTEFDKHEYAKLFDDAVERQAGVA